MTETNPHQDQPSYEELAALVAEQRQGIVKLHETIERQEALIAELQEAVNSGRRWKPKGRARYGTMTEALGVRAEAILKLAEQEAKDLREEARRAAAQHIALAEQEAARIRAEAEAEAESRATAEGADGLQA